MKKLILLACAAVLSITLQAQQIMGVKLNDNTQKEFNVSSIRRVTFRTSEIPDDPPISLSCPDDHHPHIIDLGLPSGKKWACCNVGASTPEDYGGYYAWGETEEKINYDWDSYKYGRDYDDCDYIGDDIAGTEYDVAAVKWGNPWRMPSFEMLQELVDNCTWEWTSVNDVNGYLLTGSNGGTIFLPAAGGCAFYDFVLDGFDGYYWSSTLNPEDRDEAYYLFFRSTFEDLQNPAFLFLGFPVRPVSK